MNISSLCFSRLMNIPPIGKRMFSWLLIIPLFLSISSACLAHSANETSTLIIEKGSNLEVLIDLPWSFTDAVQQANPEMPKGLSKSAFMQMAKNYVLNNFSLIKKSKKLVPNQMVEPDSNSSHNAIYKLLYQDVQLSDVEIQNTLLFNINAEQRNQIKTVDRELNESKFTTSSEKPAIILKEQKSLTAHILDNPFILAFAIALLAVFSVAGSMRDGAEPN